MSRPVPAGDRKSHASTTPTIHRSNLPLPVPDPPSELGPVGVECWTNVWTLGAGVYQPTDAYCIGRYSAMVQRRHHLLVLVEAEGWLTTGSTGQVVVHPAAKMGSDLEGRLATLEDRLGLNPESRLRLGITAVAHRSRLAKFLSEGGDA